MPNASILARSPTPPFAAYSERIMTKPQRRTPSHALSDVVDKDEKS